MDGVLAYDDAKDRGQLDQLAYIQPGTTELTEILPHPDSIDMAA